MPSPVDKDIEPKIAWECPSCGAEANEHGEGPCKSRNAKAKACDGMLCECDHDDMEDGHGDYRSKPCLNASCYHCGWGGMFPTNAIDPSKLTGWAKQAWDEGWRPPPGWEPKRESNGDR